MKLLKYLEYKESDFDAISSFRLKDELPSKVWDEWSIKEDIREQLNIIGEDFYNGQDLDADIKDIVLVGSLCNYNWSEKYSDYDLHVIIDFNDIDDNYDLVKKTCDYSKKIWNEQHDIKIKGYDVEIALQDIRDLEDSIEKGKMGGVFSLMKNEWIKKPEKKEFELDESLIKEKSSTIMMKIDDIEETIDDLKYEDFETKIDKVWDKIKDYRKSGLATEGGEFSVGNLVFKLLRRNGYINKVIKLKREQYDKRFK
jgi:hypothetical protein